MSKTTITPTQRAWEGLANTMRLYAENKVRFQQLFPIDREEAVNNIDIGMQSKLEKFHALYDVMKAEKGFEFFGHGDTSLLIVMRNAIHHHQDHDLFESWNTRMLCGFKRLSGAEFLLGSTTPEDDGTSGRNYYLLDDFYARLAHRSIRHTDRLRLMWDTELQFAAISQAGTAGRYPTDQVYVDVMPAFVAAVRRVRGWLDSTGFTPSGDDGRTYYRLLSAPAPTLQLGYKRLRIP